MGTLASQYGGAGWRQHVSAGRGRQRALGGQLGLTDGRSWLQFSSPPTLKQASVPVTEPGTTSTGATFRGSCSQCTGWSLVADIPGTEVDWTLLG